MTTDKKAAVVVGCGLGGDVIDKYDDRSVETFLGPQYLQTPAVPGVFEALRQIVEATRDPATGKCAVYIVSACDVSLRRKAEWWLEHHQFAEKTGIPQENVFFCDSRAEKAALFAKLGVTHTVDGRIEVHNALPPTTKKFLFRRDPEETGTFPAFVPQMRSVGTWDAIVAQILQDQ